MENKTLKQKTQALLEERGIYPNKRLGQNFLINEGPITALIDTIELSKKDTVLEVGPGTGNVTHELAKYAKKVLAIEKDPQMVQILEKELSGFKNIEVVNNDILKFEIQTFIQNSKLRTRNYNYKVVGAPPYYLTARLFRHFLEDTTNPPKSITVIIQKEVAEKITAKPPRMNLLAVSVQLYGDTSIVHKIPKNYFWPQPTVDSALLAVKNIKKPALNEKEFFKIVRAGFSSPRKQLAVNLSAVLNINRGEVEEWLAKNNIDPKRRAETLDIKEWVKLTNSK